MKIAVLGASGLVGRAMLSQLEQCCWVDELPLLLTSNRSAGTKIDFNNQELVCHAVNENSFDDIDIALFSAGGPASKKYAPIAAKAGAVVIDNSSAFRMDSTVPLVIPEINPTTSKGIIANPNCSTIQIAMALVPLHKEFGLLEAHITTMQSVSGAGLAAQQELENKSVTELDIIPKIGDPLSDGSFTEEDKVVNELRKIMSLPELDVTCLATRVPVWNGHSAAIRAIFASEVDREKAVKALAMFPGVGVAKSEHDFKTATEVTGKGEVAVGRLRLDPTNKNALLMWVVADNLLKGAALNAVQIAGQIAESGS